MDWCTVAGVTHHVIDGPSIVSLVSLGLLVNDAPITPTCPPLTFRTREDSWSYILMSCHAFSQIPSQH